jgi:hypothetical protein
MSCDRRASWEEFFFGKRRALPFSTSRVKAANSPGNSPSGMPKRRRRCFTPTLFTQDGASRWNSCLRSGVRWPAADDVAGGAVGFEEDRNAGVRVAKWFRMEIL